MTRADWNTPLNSVWHWCGKLARVTYKFHTTEGWYVHLRHPETGASFGNHPIEQLGERHYES